MNPPNRIEIGSAGFGEASNATLEERARQIALTDGRSEVNDLDREEARRQISDPTSDRQTSEEQDSPRLIDLTRALPLPPLAYRRAGRFPMMNRR